MGFKIAWKAFWKAIKDPSGARLFLEEKKEKSYHEDASHLRLLALLQTKGRLIDFLKEDISSFTDAQIGSAIRKVHESCGEGLEEYVTLRPIFNSIEGTNVTVSQGYDPNAIKVVGKVKGNPPYQGILRHPGWKAHKISLPKSLKQDDLSVIYPAEVEV